jgi:aspartokinase
MRSHHGVAARAFGALAAKGIEPALISTSPIKIACHLEREEIIVAAQALHREFGLHSPDAARSPDP